MWNMISLNPWRKRIGWDWLFRWHCATKLKRKAFGVIPGQLRLVGCGWLRGHQTVGAGRRSACWHSGLGEAPGMADERGGRWKPAPIQGILALWTMTCAMGGPQIEVSVGHAAQQPLPVLYRPKLHCMLLCRHQGCQSHCGCWKRWAVVHPSGAGWSRP